MLSILVGLCLLTSRTTGQEQFLAFMKADQNISIFCGLLTGDLPQYLGNMGLTVFVPSDAVMRVVDLKGYDMNTVVLNHMFESMTPSHTKVIGTTGNWSTYQRMKTRTTDFSVARSVYSKNNLFLRQTGADFLVNAALVIQPNRVNGSQVYHIIDKVLLGPDQTDFLSYLDSNAAAKKITKSAKLWKWFDTTAKKGGQKTLSMYQSFMIVFTPSLTGTILVPTDDAWAAAMSDIEFNALMNIGPTGMTNSTIEAIMGRFYIPNDIHFWRNNNIDVWAGFNVKDLNGLLKGVISADGQVSYDGYTAKIVEPNILIKYGVVHIIDNAMYKILSTSDFLAKSNHVYLNALNKFPNISQYINGSYSILALDDTTVAKNLDSPQLQEMLLNTFVSGQNALSPNGKPIATVGGAIIRLRTDQSANNYIDTLYNPTENTWIRIARVGQLNQLVGSSSVSSLNGSISKEAMSCQDMLSALNSSLYYSLLIQLKIPLELGSPYTLLVPSDTVLNAFLMSSSGTNAKIVKYVLQRMIVANRLVLQQRNNGQFRAATMNNAAMQETIGMNIVATNCTVSTGGPPGGLERTFNFSDGGFYCFSNAITDATRFNLIYPVPFVLDAPGTPQSAMSAVVGICVEPPCGRAGQRVGGTSNFITALLLAALGAFLARCQFRD